jgi:cold shock protein
MLLVSLTPALPAAGSNGTDSGSQCFAAYSPAGHHASMASNPSPSSTSNGSSTPLIGRVKFFNHERAFGFIRRDDGHSIFVHASNVHGGMLVEGDRVEFEIGTDRKTGTLQAHSVRVVPR